MVDFVYFILIGMAAGFFAAIVRKGKGFGWLMNLIIGVGGSFLGWAGFSLLGINMGSTLVGELISAFLGSVLFLVIIGKVLGRKV